MASDLGQGVRRDEWGCCHPDDLEAMVAGVLQVPVPKPRRWFAWAGRAGFGFRLRWIEVQFYWYGWKGDR